MTGKKLTLWIGIITLIGLLIYFIPYLILYLLAQDAASSLQKYENMAGAKSEYTIKITGKRWHWHYEYVKDMHDKMPLTSFHSVDPVEYKNITSQESVSQNEIIRQLKAKLRPLVLPVNTQVTLLLKSDDIIHQFKVQSLGIAKDAVPGFVSTEYVNINNTGLYAGVCGMTENPTHKRMLIAVKVVSRKDFASWLATRKSTVMVAPIASSGKRLYGQHCAICHKPDGTGVPPAFPSLKGSKLANDASGTAHITLLVKGGKVMRPYSHLKDAELAAIVNYVHSAWGNKGKQIKETDVANARKSLTP